MCLEITLHCFLYSLYPLYVPMFLSVNPTSFLTISTFYSLASFYYFHIPLSPLMGPCVQPAKISSSRTIGEKCFKIGAAAWISRLFSGQKQLNITANEHNSATRESNADIFDSATMCATPLYLEYPSTPRSPPSYPPFLCPSHPSRPDSKLVAKTRGIMR